MIPGLFVALLLRLDAELANVNPFHAEYKSFPKPYFIVNLVFYALGLVATVGVMYYFHAAQVFYQLFSIIYTFKLDYLWN